MTRAGAMCVAARSKADQHSLKRESGLLAWPTSRNAVHDSRNRVERDELHARFRSGNAEIGIARISEAAQFGETVWNDRLAIVTLWCSHTQHGGL